jgi:hypothetical protein
MHRLGYVLATCAIFLSGCATDRSASTATPYLNPFFGTGDNISYWDGDEIGGQPSIKIDLVEQRAYFYKEDQLVGVSVASTGREGTVRHRASFVSHRKTLTTPRTFSASTKVGRS